MDTHELAWAAGFFDGEGNIRFRAKDHGVSMSVSQVDRRPLERFQEAVGGVGRIYLSGRANEASRKNDIHAWGVTNWRAAQYVTALLWKYLSPPKRAQATGALRSAHDSAVQAPTFGGIPLNQGGRQMWCKCGRPYEPGTRLCSECAWKRTHDACPRCGATKGRAARYCQPCANRARYKETCVRGHMAWTESREGRRRCAECRRQDAAVAYHAKRHTGVSVAHLTADVSRLDFSTGRVKNADSDGQPRT